MKRFLLMASLGLALGAQGVLPAASHADGGKQGRAARRWEAPPTRFATFNVALNRFNEGDLVNDLSTPDNAQAQAVAEIIQRVRPDVILLNEFDYDAEGQGIALFQENYLAVGQNGADPIEYPYVFNAPVNTGIPSGFDLNNDEQVGGPDDALGFGYFPGQYGMVVLSRYPLVTKGIRTFQNFLWRDMPGAKLPEGWYSDDELAVFPLSSKSHWDIPVWVGCKVVHFLTSHPTPPVFDGDEDRNGRRNHDEIRFWADYVDRRRSSYIYDDEGRRGGLRGTHFVIAGDQNADPVDGDSTDDAILQLIEHRLINTSVIPSSEGGAEAAALQGGANDDHLGNPAYDTGDFADGSPGNLRADYVLPSKSLTIKEAGVFWPVSADPLSALTGTYPFPSSDHRLVWVDVTARRR